jgi:hypothetical protein
MFEHIDQSIKVFVIRVAEFVGVASGNFAKRHHQLCEAGRLANRVAVTGNGLFGFYDRNILVANL